MIGINRTVTEGITEAVQMGAEHSLRKCGGGCWGTASAVGLSNGGLYGHNHRRDSVGNI